MKPAIRLQGVSKVYRRMAAGHKLRTLKSALFDRDLLRGLRPEESIPALKDISFQVGKGESVGLIGSNGSGKSTLLKMVAGILQPTTGTIDVEGKVAALIELGAGFHPEISGRENIYINGAVLGLSRREIDRRFDDIVEFSGLENFIEEPVKNYSSGMYVRLGFSVAVHTDPDVLLVDEVLAVGDESFAHRCQRRIEEMLSQGRTLLLVSHSLTLIEEMCDRALWIDDGRVRENGQPRRVADAYRQAVAEQEGRIHREEKAQREESPEARHSAEEPLEEEPAEGAQEEVLRWGSGDVEILRLRTLVGEDAAERYHLRSGEAVTFEIELKVHRAVEDFVFGVALATPRGLECWGTNTDLGGYLPSRLEEGESRVRLTCPELRLGPGEYLVDVAAHARDGTPYDYRRKLVALSVTAADRGIGVYFPEHRWSFSQGIEWQMSPSEPKKD